MGTGLLAAMFGLGGGPEITIDNRSEESTMVYIDGEKMGRVRADKSRSFKSQRGEHVVELQNLDGELLVSEAIRVRANQPGEVRLLNPSGFVELHNDSGTTLAIKVDGKKKLDIRSGESEWVELDAGSHKIRAIYPYLGDRKTLDYSQVDVVNDMVTGVQYGPDDTGWVRVRNAFGSWANVKINGKSVQRISKNEVLDLKVPLGKVELSFWREGQELFRKHVDVKPFEENFIRAESNASDPFSYSVRNK